MPMPMPRRIRRHHRCAIALSTAAAALAAVAIHDARAQALAPFVVAGDAIAEPLSGLSGDTARGRTVAFDPERGNCTICHAVPGGDARTQGNVGPPLAGVGSRLTAGQLRLRLVDGTRINPYTIMPPYHRIAGLERVGREWIGKPVLNAQQIEDLVAFLATLTE
jgi:sulfur-oxidizing protein SoxX